MGQISVAAQNRERAGREKRGEADSKEKRDVRGGEEKNDWKKKQEGEGDE